MTQKSAQPQNIQPLLKKLHRHYKPDDPPASEPVTQLVMGMFQWEATRKQAEQAFSRLMKELVDINEVRVSRDDELVEIIGVNYPRAEERVARLREALNEIFVREHGVAMHSIASKNKKDQRAYLDSLAGVPPYVAAQVMLFSYGGHALPIDEKLLGLLAEQEIVDPDTTPTQAEGSLLRQVKAAEALHAHVLLQAWGDDSKAGRAAATGSKTGKKKKVASPKSKKTTASKTSANRSGGKKSTSKKASTSKTTKKKSAGSRTRRR